MLMLRTHGWVFVFFLSVRVYVCIGSCLFVFVKQNTAYEMRIIDWSSDVCSSDLCRCQFGSRLAKRSGIWRQCLDDAAIGNGAVPALDDHAAQFGSKGIQIPQFSVNLGKMFAGDRIHGATLNVFLIGELEQFLNLISEERRVGKECVSK